MKSHHISFKHALDGILHNFKTQPNFRVHLFFTALILALASILSLAPWEWLILVFTITLVIIAEMLNTALESMVDLISLKHHQLAKIAKDTAAGMVLITAIAAVVVGIIIFSPHLLPLLNT